MLHHETIIDECIKRWGADDDQIKTVRSFYSDWINQISDEAYSVIVRLLSFFDYYSHLKVNEALKKLHQELDRETISFDNTIYSVIPNQLGRICSGYNYILDSR